MWTLIGIVLAQLSPCDPNAEYVVSLNEEDSFSPSSPAYINLTTSFKSAGWAITFWMKTSSSHDFEERILITNRVDANDQRSRGFTVALERGWIFLYADTMRFYGFSGGIQPLTDNRWHFIAVVVSTNSVTITVDSMHMTYSNSLSEDLLEKPIILGNDASGLHLKPFRGQIDNLALFNGEVSPDTVAAVKSGKAFRSAQLPSNLVALFRFNGDLQNAVSEDLGLGSGNVAFVPGQPPATVITQQECDILTQCVYVDGVCQPDPFRCSTSDQCVKPQCRHDAFGRCVRDPEDCASIESSECQKNPRCRRTLNGCVPDRQQCTTYTDLASCQSIPECAWTSVAEDDPGTCVPNRSQPCEIEISRTVERSEGDTVGYEEMVRVPCDEALEERNHYLDSENPSDVLDHTVDDWSDVERDASQLAAVPFNSGIRTAATPTEAQDHIHNLALLVSAASRAAIEALQDPTLINNQLARELANDVAQAVNLTLTLTTEQATLAAFGEGWTQISRAWAGTGTWKQAYAQWRDVVQTARDSSMGSEYWDAWIAVLQRIEEATAAMIYLQSRGFTVIGNDIPRPTCLVTNATGTVRVQCSWVPPCASEDIPSPRDCTVIACSYGSRSTRSYSSQTYTASAKRSRSKGYASHSGRSGVGYGSGGTRGWGWSRLDDNRDCSAAYNTPYSEWVQEVCNCRCKPPLVNPTGAVWNVSICNYNGAPVVSRPQPRDEYGSSEQCHKSRGSCGGKSLKPKGPKEMCLCKEDLRRLTNSPGKTFSYGWEDCKLKCHRGEECAKCGDGFRHDAHGRIVC